MIDNENIFKRIGKALVEKCPSAISLNSIAKEFEIGSHRTVYEYIDIMEKMFIVKTLYFLDLENLLPNFKKNRNVHFIDLFYFHLFFEVSFAKLPEELIIVESIVASHLARKFEVFYWKNKREIDVIAIDKEGNSLGFEVKWKETKEDYSKIRVGKIKSVICLSKSMDKEKNIIFLPAFLAIL
ncbi:MAG: DUF234 domain-containing protein [Candidatus Aenigmatarchaeota archaeon]